MRLTLTLLLLSNFTLFAQTPSRPTRNGPHPSRSGALIKPPAAAPSTTKPSIANRDAAAALKPDPTKPLPTFPVYIYKPSDRDPFISPNAPGTLVRTKAPAAVPENQETLEMLMTRLGNDITASTKLLGISTTSDGRECFALVQFSNTPIGGEEPGAASGPNGDAGGQQAQAGPAEEMQPAKTVTAKDGFPIKTTGGDLSYVTRLAAKIAIESGVRLERDKKKNIIYMPILKIDESGISIGVAGTEKPILIPLAVDYDTRADYDKTPEEANPSLPEVAPTAPANQQPYRPGTIPPGATKPSTYPLPRPAR